MIQLYVVAALCCFSTVAHVGATRVSQPGLSGFDAEVSPEMVMVSPETANASPDPQPVMVSPDLANAPPELADGSPEGQPVTGTAPVEVSVSMEDAYPIDALFQPSIDTKMLEEENKMDNEKCRILCQSPYSCRTHAMLRWKKTHEICQRWGMRELGEPFQQEMDSPTIDLGHCMRKCDKVFPLEAGVRTAPAPKDRSITPAPVAAVSPTQVADGAPEALPTLSPAELKKEDEEYIRETTPRTPKKKNKQDDWKRKYPKLVREEDKIEDDDEADLSLFLQSDRMYQER